ncbi:hypothetical protein, partial [Klebsiella pneumoniae]|uniref:hypothetical protein n=1 Tax=Klebsiella pneumoniae TaxID=573 RepID=UPI001C5324C1
CFFFWFLVGCGGWGGVVVVWFGLGFGVGGCVGCWVVFCLLGFVVGVLVVVVLVGWGLVLVVLWVGVG